MTLRASRSSRREAIEEREAGLDADPLVRMHAGEHDLVLVRAAGRGRPGGGDERLAAHGATDLLGTRAPREARRSTASKSRRAAVGAEAPRLEHPGERGAPVRERSRGEYVARVDLGEARHLVPF